MTNRAKGSYDFTNPIVFRFTTYGGTSVGEKQYDRVMDMVLRGSVMYLALGSDSLFEGDSFLKII